MAALPTDTMHFIIINHFFLPLKLPSDAEISAISLAAERDLLKIVHDRVEGFGKFCAQRRPQESRLWGAMKRMLEFSNMLASTPSLPAQKFVEAS